MDCDYCNGGPLMDRYYIKIQELDNSTLYLFREQSHRGRCMVCSKLHVDEIADMTEEQCRSFMRDVQRAAKALHAAFHPDRVNYGAYNDAGHHAHFHLVPKYKDDSFEWSSVFAMEPGRVYLSEEEYHQIAESIRKNL